MNKTSLAHKLVKWKNKSLGDKIFLIVIYSVTILITFICLYPLYFTVIASFSSGNAVYGGRTFWHPVEFTTQAYQMVFEHKEVWLGYRNTIIYTFLGTCWNLFLTIPAAYALGREQMMGRSFFMKIFMITMYFGGGLVPTYILVNNLGMINTVWSMIILGGVSVYNVIVTRTFFQNNIPESLLEAARIDGASEFYIFGRIVLPLSGAIIAVMTLYYAVGHWSSYFNAQIYLRDNALHPLQLVLRRILMVSSQLVSDAEQAGLSEADRVAQQQKAYLALTMRYSLVFISSLPMLIIYPFVQKYFVKGVMVGSVKG